MPQLLLELFCEEIPARMQANAAAHLKKAVTDALVSKGLLYEAATSYVTPRRLALIIHGLPTQSKETMEEKKGPRLDAPEAALQGFLKSSGLASLAEAVIVNDPKKGSFYTAQIRKKGESTPQIVAALMPEIIKNFPWPKAMRWGAASRQAGALKWVRPLQSILCLYKNEHEEAEIIPFEISDIVASDTTQGHRFHSQGLLKIKSPDDYAPQLLKAKVIVDASERAKTLLHDARTLCFAQGLELVEDEALAQEVAGLVEYPVVLMGSFEENFLDIPPEVIRTTIRANQKCFVVKKDGKLTNRFIIISNLAASDGGAAIIAGNERVIRARLSDAKFFYETDKAKTLESRLEKFKTITYHEKIGTQYARIERLTALAEQIGAGLDPALVRNAAKLAKADLVTEMVGEFPELEGLMGRYYYAHENSNDTTGTALAIEQHYRPKGPSDKIPETYLGQVIAMADKLDMLIQFWLINEKPTGSKDPYALRRAALGIIRIVLETGQFANFHEFIPEAIKTDLMKFMQDRFKTQLIDNGARHDVVEAVLQEGGYNFKILAQKAEEMSAFLATPNGQQQFALFTRVNNILRAEEKKGAIAYKKLEEIDGKDKEISIKNDISEVEKIFIYNNNFYEHLGLLADEFDFIRSFEKYFANTLINSDIPEERLNRLSLLNAYRELCLKVADFTKIVG